MTLWRAFKLTNDAETHGAEMKCAELTGVETHRAESHRAETIFAESGPALTEIMAFYSWHESSVLRRLSNV